jgi:hypothetical protein
VRITYRRGRQHRQQDAFLVVSGKLTPYPGAVLGELQQLTGAGLGQAATGRPAVGRVVRYPGRDQDPARRFALIRGPLPGAGPVTAQILERAAEGGKQGLDVAVKRA